MIEEMNNHIFNAPPSIPKIRQEALKFNGWGYKDAQFLIMKDKNLKFTGENYEEMRGKELPDFVDFMERTMNVDISETECGNALEKTWGPEDVSLEVQNEALVKDMSESGLSLSRDVADRIFRGHGHTVAEMVALRRGRLPRVPDVVVWPRSHAEVVTVVDAASRFGAVIIPFGGGTSVTGALLCREGERRMIISLDTSCMNSILWLDDANMTVRMEAGIVGQDMERRLADLGFCVGHEPDSFEFSSLGGWVATRASGMRKNVYGNIEDLVVHVTMVTARGVMQRDCQAPRVSLGPDVHQFILGSEGTLGVITEVTLKIRRLPKCKKYGSIIFPDLESGFLCLRELTKQRIFPASIRLMDNEQFHFGLALKSRSTSILTTFLDSAKRLYLLNYKGYDPHRLCVATLLMEGDSSKEVLDQERNLLSVAKQHRGVSGGEDNGRRGYLLTFVIAYIRDLALDHGIMAESFEMSVPWDKAIDLCAAVKRRVGTEARLLGIVKPVFISCRITQMYDAGVCVYFYLALSHLGMDEAGGPVDPVEVYERVESAARDEILDMGGSLSHHHGVGKIRSKWLERVVSSVGMAALRNIKRSLDPDDIFANGALLHPALHAKL